MSYILDALNKADKERKMRETPSMSATSSDVSEPKRAHPLLWVIGMAVVFLGSLAFMFQPKEVVEQVKTTTVINPPVVVTAQPRLAETTPEAATPVVTEVKPEIPRDFQPKTQPVNQVAKPSEPRQSPHIRDLDESVRSQVPPISISAHIYSKDTMKRMVIINNRMLHERDYIAKKLMLTAIQENHIELNYDGHAFMMGIKDAWPPY
ncbi:MAG: general secretion pathway protein GspB [Ghiorsea sp.]